MRIGNYNIRDVFHYNPDNGKLYWKLQQGNVKWGDEAGHKDKKKGYIKINFGGKTYLAHRLIWLYIMGKWPEYEIDHENGRKDDNRWVNLRDATKSQNNRNKPAPNGSFSGIKGVVKGKNGKFRVMLCMGTYDTKEEASKVYNEAALKFQGEFAHWSLRGKR